MTVSASCWLPLRVVGSLRLRNWAREVSDRGVQDKSRKVRPVGRLGNASIFSHHPNIAKVKRNLPFSMARCSSLVFGTLWRAK